jgi:hypothetical protein
MSLPFEWKRDPAPVKTDKDIEGELESLNRILREKLALDFTTFEDVSPIQSAYLEIFDSSPDYLLELGIENKLIDLDLFVQMNRLQPATSGVQEVQILLFQLLSGLGNNDIWKQVMDVWLCQICDPLDPRSCATFLYIVETFLENLSFPCEEESLDVLMLDEWIRHRQTIVLLSKIRLGGMFLSKSIAILRHMLLWTGTERGTIADILLENHYIKNIESSESEEWLPWRVDVVMILVLLMQVRPEQVIAPAMRIVDKILSTSMEDEVLQQVLCGFVKQAITLNRPEVDAWLKASNLLSTESRSNRLID